MSNYDEIETEEWKGDESGDDMPLEEDEQEMGVAPRIFQGQESNIHYSAETGYGMLSTTAEGKMGDMLKKISSKTNTPEEKFRDNLIKVLAELSVPRSTGNAIMKLIPRIPDIKYKSPAMCLFGYLAVNLIGRPLTSGEDKRQFSNILSQLQLLKDRNKRVSELDVVRYAKMFKKILNERQSLA